MNVERTGVKVLYIMGSGRSGTTILDNILGELPGFFSGGEMRYLWERGLLGRGQCGAGEPIRNCRLWSESLKEGFGPPGHPDPSQVVAWQRAALRVRYTWQLLRLHPRDLDMEHPAARYAHVAARLYHGTAEVAGARVIIDSSKRPSDAALLNLLPGVEPFFVHLVRDPRAVAYSWKRPKAWRKEEEQTLMTTHGPAASTAQWASWNLAAEAVARHAGRGRSIRFRYEDFMRAPQATVESIAAMLGEHRPTLPFEDASTVRLTGNHSASGNPSRFFTGMVRLSSDDEWVKNQPVADRLIVTALALPLLARYGYPILAARQRH